MPDKPWKQFERDSASLFGGVRFPANIGERVDFHGTRVRGQCKLVKSLSLEALTKLVEEMDSLTKNTADAGVVCVKVRRGTGKSSPPLAVFSFDGFKKLMEYWMNSERV
jgi:hypothetical protein